MAELKYQELAQRLRDELAGGTWPAGARLPTEDAMVAAYGVSKQTVRRAVGLLVDEGLLQRRQGSGTYAAGQQRSPTRTIGVIATYLSEYILPSMIRGIEEVTAAEGYRFLLRSTGNRMDRERELLEYFLANPVDGLIVEGAKTALPNPNLSLYRQLRTREIPVVFLSGWYPALEQSVYVITDDDAGGAMAARCLLGHGHRRIGGIFKADDQQGHRRFAGFANACREQGVNLSDDCFAWYTTEQREGLLTGQSEQAILRMLAPCTAVVCYNDQIAAPLMASLLRAGRRVPEDIAVISFDRSVYSDLTPVPLTSLAHPKEEIGRVAARKLLHILHGRREHPAVLPWTLEERQSTAAEFKIV